jgi:hypothetical protein
MVAAARSRDTGIRSDAPSSGTHDFRETENMHQNHIQSKNGKSLLQLLTGSRMARLSPLAAVALGMAISACLSPATAHAQEISMVRVAGKLPLLLP